MEFVISHRLGFVKSSSTWLNLCFSFLARGIARHHYHEAAPNVMSQNFLSKCPTVCPRQRRAHGSSGHCLEDRRSISGREIILQFSSQTEKSFWRFLSFKFMARGLDIVERFEFKCFSRILLDEYLLCDRLLFLVLCVTRDLSCLMIKWLSGSLFIS